MSLVELSSYPLTFSGLPQVEAPEGLEGEYAKGMAEILRGSLEILDQNSSKFLKISHSFVKALNLLKSDELVRPLSLEIILPRDVSTEYVNDLLELFNRGVVRQIKVGSCVAKVETIKHFHEKLPFLDDVKGKITQSSVEKLAVFEMFLQKV